MRITRLGTAANDKLFGHNGDDEFLGGDGHDTMFGNNGADIFHAGAGHDRMHAGAGADSLFGGAGNDIAYADSGADLVEGGEGSDTIYAGSGADTVYGEAAGITAAVAGVSYDDLIELGAGNDLAFGGLGSDEIQGEGGNDTISGGKDNGRLVWTGGNPGGGPGGNPGGEQPGGGGTGGTPGGEPCTGVKSLSFRIAATHDGTKPGNPAVAVTVTEGGDGTLRFSVTVEPNGKNVADLRGLFFQVENEALASSLTAKGGWVTGFKGAEDAIDNLGGGVNAQGVKTGPFDFGLSFGTSGIGKDDVRQAEFTLASGKGPIGLDLLDGMDFAARLTSFGAEGGSRGGSLKLVGNSGAITETCPTKPAAPAAPASPAPAAEAPAAPAAAKTLAEVVIGDNLYGNDGRDTFLFAKGDGVDLIWDFEAGQDVLQLSGYRIADMDAVTFVTTVANAGRDGVNPLDAGSHEKLALILDAAGDAIVFNDLGDRGGNAAAIRFEDGTLSVNQLLAMATPATSAAAEAVEGEEVAARIAVVNAWAGGFQGEITVTALSAVTDWDVLLGTKWTVKSVWGAARGETTATQGGVLIDLDDAGWNGQLAAGGTATIGFTATTGTNVQLGAQAILDGLWIG
jgi:Ca2+-binding RTX toxin-like protein